VISAIKARNGLTEDCEITLEANPDSVTAEKLEGYIAAGFNRISFGMQSTSTHVLKVLDRTHDPENVKRAVDMARAAGFASVSVDLIYGTPGESLKDWQSTVTQALNLGVDHISAYALIIEEGTKLAAQIKRGEVASPDDDLMADMYLYIDQACGFKGLKWYELSNWAKPGHECRHNIAYWKSSDWWGLGPGAHSHIDRKRFWNVKHPTAYKQRLFDGQSPIADSEELTDEMRKSEYIMLASRMRTGIAKRALTVAQYERLSEYIKADQIIDGPESLVLTATGRLIADRIVADLLA
jgi:oxygen-independent coproporphyrinogen-3 oxidase